MKKTLFLAIATIFCMIVCYPARAISPKYTIRMVADTVCHGSDTAEITQIDRVINTIRVSDSATMPSNAGYSSRVIRKHRVKQLKVDSRNPYLAGNIASGVVFSFIMTVTIVMLRLI